MMTDFNTNCKLNPEKERSIKNTQQKSTLKQMKIVAFYTIFVLLQNIHVFAQKVKLWLHLPNLI